MCYLAYGMVISVPRPMMTTPSTATTSDWAGNVYHNPNMVTIILLPLMHSHPPTVLYQYDLQWSVYQKYLVNELQPEWTVLAAVLHMRNCTWEAARLLHAINGTSSGDHSSSISKNFLFTLDGCKPFIPRHLLKWTLPPSFNERRGVLRVPRRLYQIKYMKLI